MLLVLHKIVLTENEAALAITKFSFCGALFKHILSREQDISKM